MLKRLRLRLRCIAGWGGFADLEGLQLIHDGRQSRVYRHDLKRLPQTHHIANFLNLVMQSQDWAQRNVRILRSSIEDGARTAAIPRVARFCKNCSLYAGFTETAVPSCNCSLGVRRLEGHWDRDTRAVVSRGSSKRHCAISIPLEERGSSNELAEDYSVDVEIVLHATSGSIQVEILGAEKPLRDLRRRLSDEPPGKKHHLSLTGHVLSTIESASVGGKALEKLQRHIDEWGQVLVDAVGDELETASSDIASASELPEEYLLVLDESLITNVFDRDSDDDVQRAVVRWLERAEISEAPSVAECAQSIDASGIETMQFVLQEPSVRMVTCLLAGSSLKLRLTPSAAGRLALHGIGPRASRLGTPVSMYRVAELSG